VETSDVLLSDHDIVVPDVVYGSRSPIGIGDIERSERSRVAAGTTNCPPQIAPRHDLRPGVQCLDLAALIHVERGAGRSREISKPSRKLEAIAEERTHGRPATR
jgi:hypothetical protein